MRFTTAWSGVSAQNTVLRSVIVIQALMSITLGVYLAKVSDRPPVVVQRACFSEVVGPVSNERTVEEIKAFVKEAIAQRFNSDASFNASFFNSDERNLRWSGSTRQFLDGFS